MKRTLVRLTLVLLVIACLGTGCKKKQAEELGSGTKEIETETQIFDLKPVTEITETEISHEGQVKSFLTGEWVDEKIADNRPIALMVENTKMALPQYGLGQADIIYECPVEGGISRLMAVYQDYSGMKKMGNVRSCRHYYVYLAKEYDAVYFHAGASPIAYKGVLAGSFIEGVDGITGKGGKYFYRDSSEKSAPHNLYTSSDRLESAVKDYGFSQEINEKYKEHYHFTEDGQSVDFKDGQEALKISMYYPNAKPWFEYNKEDGLYYRFEFGIPQKDGLTGKQLAVTNIILQNCNSKIVDDIGRLDIDLSSGGKGMYITNGKYIHITWTKNSEYGITHYYDENGQEIILNQGKTWVEIVQNGYADKNVISGP